MGVLRPTAHDAARVRRALEDQPDANVYLLSVLQTWGLEDRDGASWWAVAGDEALRAAAWLGRPEPDPGARVLVGLAVPWGDPDACATIGAALAPTGPPRMVIGPRAAADGLWRGLGDPTPRLWYDQRLYVCTGVSAGPRLELRPARPDELPLVVEMSARMMAEDLGEDPRAVEGEAFARRTLARVHAGRCLLGLHAGEVVFKVDIGSRWGPCVQVGGTWVPPAHRGRGLGAAGMRALCDRLQPRSPRVSLHVHEQNHAAVRTYLRAGFVAADAFRLAST